MATATIDRGQAQQLFNAYLNTSTTLASNFLDFVFGIGDRSFTGDIDITGDLDVTGDITAEGNVLTNSLDERTTAGLIIGSTTNRKLAFWGATPVVQQIAATGTSMTVDQLLTKLQLIGIFKQG